LGGFGVCRFTPSVLPDISPSRGEIDSWIGLAYHDVCK